MPQSVTKETDLDVLVIGGGISGLATAWNLAQKGLRVQVWEKSVRPGGKIKTDCTDGFLTERSASMVMNFKPEVDQFLQQTGLQRFKAERQQNAQSNRYLLHRGQLQPLPTTLTGMMFSSLWSHSGKFRLFMEPFIGRGQKRNETVTEFVVRRFGREFLEKAMEPFISGTMASDPDLASARHVIPRLTALEKNYGSITAGMLVHKIQGKRTARNPEHFSFTGGMTTMIKHLAEDPATGFQANTTVRKLIRHGSYHWEVQALYRTKEMSCTAQQVVLACPADCAARLVPSSSQNLSQHLTQIHYAPLSVVHIGLHRPAIAHPLDGSGFLVPRQEQMAINGNLWMSSAFSHRAPDNHVLLSSYLGGSRHPEAVQLSPDEAIERVLNDIRPLLGITDSPVMTRVDKHFQALPLYHGHYQQTLTAIEHQLRSLPGLHLVANYKGGVSIRDRIIAAQQAAKLIAEQLPVPAEPVQRAALSQTLAEKPA